MSVLLINYATPEFRHSQRLNLKSGIETAGFDRALGYRTRDIETSFYRENRDLLNHPRGAGYWLWKPYFILRALRTLKPGDFLFYSDAGAIFLEPVSHLVNLADEHDIDVLVFDTRFVEKQWTKRDAFLLTNCDEPFYTDSIQRGATFSMWRCTEFALHVVQQVLEFCQDPRIISDQPNVLGKENYPEFRQNRHDQSVLSLVTKMHGIPAFRPLHAVGNPLRESYPASTYPQMVNLTRKQNSSLGMRLSRRWERLVREYKSGTFLRP